MTKQALAALTLAAFAAAQRPPADPFSNSFAIGFYSGDPPIREVTTTLVLPPFDTTQKGFLKLYPELYTTDTASLTGTALTVPEGLEEPCASRPQDWCVCARLVLENIQNSGDLVPAPVGSELGIKVTYDEATKKHDHTISVNGKVVSTISVSSDLNLLAGRGLGFRTQVECQLDSCGVVSRHEYINTKIVLDAPNPTWAETKNTTRSSGDMVTADGGLTWTIAKIVIDEFDYDA